MIRVHTSIIPLIQGSLTLGIKRKQTTHAQVGNTFQRTIVNIFLPTIVAYVLVEK